MAKDKSESEIREKKEKKEKKDKKRKHDEVEEIEASTTKKDKKDKKRKSVDAGEDVSMVADTNGDISLAALDDDAEGKKVAKGEIPLAALVPFANPLCDDKAMKKVLKSVKKAAKHKTIKRGVKECVKAIRKSPASDPSVLTVAGSNSGKNLPHGIVVLAADISPMDVISHIPVLCEDNNIPYVYVRSRAELGAAGSTKRPTSVVMVTAKGPAKKQTEDAGEVADWEEVYKDLHRLSVKLGQTVKV